MTTTEKPQVETAHKRTKHWRWVCNQIEASYLLHPCYTHSPTSSPPRGPFAWCSLSSTRLRYVAGAHPLRPWRSSTYHHPGGGGKERRGGGGEERGGGGGEEEEGERREKVEGGLRLCLPCCDHICTLHMRTMVFPVKHLDHVILAEADLKPV